MATEKFSIREALTWGWRTALRNLLPLAILVLSSGILGLIQSSTERVLGGPGTTGVLRVALGTILWTVFQVLQLLLSVLWIHIALRLHDGAPIALPEVPKLVSLFFNYLLGSVLYGLIVVGGLILLVVPGVIWAIRYGFYGVLIVDRELDPLTALRESARLTHGQKGRLFFFGLALVGINIVGAMAFGIGLLVTIPTTMLAVTYVYRRLAAWREPAEPVARDFQPSPA